MSNNLRDAVFHINQKVRLRSGMVLADDHRRMRKLSLLVAAVGVRGGIMGSCEVTWGHTPVPMVTSICASSTNAWSRRIGVAFFFGDVGTHRHHRQRWARYHELPEKAAHLDCVRLPHSECHVRIVATNSAAARSMVPTCPWAWRNFMLRFQMPRRPSTANWATCCPHNAKFPDGSPACADRPSLQ